MKRGDEKEGVVDDDQGCGRPPGDRDAEVDWHDRNDFVVSASSLQQQTFAGLMTNELIVIAAKYLFLAIPAAAVAYWVVIPPNSKKYLLVLAIIVGFVSVGIGRLIAHFYFDPRPFVRGHFIPLIPHEPDNGFPSDHTLLSSSIAATVTACNARLGVLLWVITAIVGVARVAAGLHSPIDVLGSICIASGTAAVAHVLLRRRIAR